MGVRSKEIFTSNCSGAGIKLLSSGGQPLYERSWESAVAAQAASCTEEKAENAGADHGYPYLSTRIVASGINQQLTPTNGGEVIHDHGAK
jgi:hypothetical protein